MTTATPELKIEPKLPVLAFNFEQLKAWATALAEHYAAIVVTEDAIADVKRDMAELNKAKKAAATSRPAVEQKPASVEQPVPKTEQPAAPAQTRAMSIVLEYDVANEAAVKTCLENLKTLCVNFGARYR